MTGWESGKRTSIGVLEAAPLAHRHHFAGVSDVIEPLCLTRLAQGDVIEIVEIITRSKNRVVSGAGAEEIIAILATRRTALRDVDLGIVTSIADAEVGIQGAIPGLKLRGAGVAPVVQGPIGHLAGVAVPGDVALREAQAIAGQILRKGQTALLEVGNTHGIGGGVPRFLHQWHDQTQEDRDDHDDRQDLEHGVGVFACRFHPASPLLLERLVDLYPSRFYPGSQQMQTFALVF